mgnify:FL=1|jgi:hypothetical protein
MKMQYSEWEPIYDQILADMGYDKGMDETSVRILKMVTLNSDLIDEDELASKIGKVVTVFGNSPGLEDDIRKMSPVGTLIASGSSVPRLLRLRIIPDIVVTDLDGDMTSQIEASDAGDITLLHAHGDNPSAILMYASRFRGPVILTTQSKPENTVFDFGGFTDGDRAVCLARHFGADRILLEGFDFEHPNFKDGSDPAMKLKKLKWAKKIIYDHNPKGVEIVTP